MAKVQLLKFHNDNPKGTVLDLPIGVAIYLQKMGVAKEYRIKPTIKPKKDKKAKK